MLTVATALLTAALRLGHLPAAFMLGPMGAAIAFAIRRPGLTLPRPVTATAQATLGCLIAMTLTPRMIADLAPRWPLLLGMNAAVILGFTGLGVLVARMRWLPGTAGIWGMSPGGAAAMVTLAEAYGGDRRLVAVMQYLRLLLASFTVILVGTLLGTPHVGSPAIVLPGAAGQAWLVRPDPLELAATVALAAAAVGLSRLLRRPPLVLLLPVFGGVALQMVGGPRPAVPPLLSALAFMMSGWHIGLGFTRASLARTARLIPRIVACVAAVLALCGALALVLAHVAGTSFLTAYMALNPGGADAVMALAASISVDLPLILSMQVTRLIMVILIAPVIARHLAASAIGAPPPAESIKHGPF